MTTKEQVYTAVRAIFDRGFAADDSVFTPGRRVWTRSNAEDLVVRLENPPSGVSGTFLKKLQAELDGAASEVVQLAAEILYLHLVPSLSVKGAAKRFALRSVLGIPRESVSIPPDLDEVLDGGIMYTGVAFNTYRAQQVTWLARVVAHLKSRPPSTVSAVLADPWSFRALLDEIPTTTARAQRMALLRLAFPGTFLDAVSVVHLGKIVDTFRHEIDAPSGDEERDFAAIRAAMEAREGPVDFYAPRWARLWEQHGEEQRAPSDISYPRGWLVRGANVQGRNLVPRWLEDGYCSLSLPGYDRVEVDLTRSQLAQVVREAEPDLSATQERARVALLDRFLNQISDGDLVVTVNEARVHVGVVASGPYWVPGQLPAHSRREVRWFDVPLRRSDLSDSTQDRLTGQQLVVSLGDSAREFADAVEIDLSAANGDGDASAETSDGLWRVVDLDRADVGVTSPEPPEVIVEQPPLEALPAPTEKLSGELLVDHDWLVETVDLLDEKKQLVLYGPPGTGKTYLAQEIARFVAEQTNGTPRLVQFHPSYAYEDFVEGFRPGLGADGTFRFSKEYGPLRRLVEDAAANPSGAYVLVIDEINRANLAKVFGELYFLLEYRNRTIELQYSAGEDFRLPSNLFVIGTMNTADRSIALVDAAMRRRFAWQPLFPGEPPVADMLRRWLARHNLPAHIADLLDVLNAAIGDRDAAVGPSYLMNRRVATEAGLARIWRTQILPLLEERHLGEHADVAAYVHDRYGLAALLAMLPASVVGGGAGDAAPSSSDDAGTADSGAAAPTVPPVEEPGSGAGAAGR